LTGQTGDRNQTTAGQKSRGNTHNQIIPCTKFTPHSVFIAIATTVPTWPTSVQPTVSAFATAMNLKH
jgi:hypothetical protein